MKLHHLNPRQERFVDEYLKCLNASEAARQAGYSMKSSPRFALELLTKPHITDALRKRRHDIAITSNLSCLRVLQELVSVGMSDIGQIVKQDEKGNIEVNSLDELPKHVRASIASIECKEEGQGWKRKKTTKVTLWPKQPALDSLIKMLGYDKQAVESELAAQLPENKAKANMIDPKLLTNEEFAIFRKINERRLDALKP